MAEWCELNLLSRALLRHNDPSDDYFLPLHKTFVLSYDIKPERQLIQITYSSAHCALNALRALETGWVIQLNGDATFGFCRAELDMIELGFNSLGAVNHPACWSLIPHQFEGKLVYFSYLLSNAADCHFPFPSQHPEEMCQCLLLIASRLTKPASKLSFMDAPIPRTPERKWQAWTRHTTGGVTFSVIVVL